LGSLPVRSLLDAEAIVINQKRIGQVGEVREEIEQRVARHPDWEPPLLL
jgi:hypothetical protein